MKKRFPKVYLVGCTAPDEDCLIHFLEETDQTQFMDDIDERENVSPQGILTSLNAKLCYRSLNPAKNPNLKGSRSLAENIAGILKSAHGSVLEHVSLNFVIADCSRVFTHELVRHRVGTAFSQTSGRYCAIDPGTLEVVWDPILDGCEKECAELLIEIERTIYIMECRKGIRHFDPLNMYVDCPGEPQANWYTPETTWQMYIEEDDPRRLWPRNPNCDFTLKKQLTSAFRRFAPNGQYNEIGFTSNVRTLRHLFMLRTSLHAEWEIRYVFCQMWHIVQAVCPELFADAVIVPDDNPDDGPCLFQVTGMKINPYETVL